MDIDIIIPGRGPHIGKEFLIRTHQWMEKVLEILRRYCNEEIPESQISKQEYPDHPQNLGTPGLKVELIILVL